MLRDLFWHKQTDQLMAKPDSKYKILCFTELPADGIPHLLSWPKGGFHMHITSMIIKQLSDIISSVLFLHFYFLNAASFLR